MAEGLQIQCVDCGRVAPETETAYTLIGQRHGWRLTFLLDDAGKRSPEWRCPECFRRAKLPDSGGSR
jgi:hypothetical protein